MAIVIEALLRKAGLLQGLHEDAASALLERVVVQTYEPGAFLVTEGEIGDAAYVLLAGSLQVLATQPDGGWIPLSRLEPGALFGEQALLGRAGGRRAATVRAIGPVTVARLGAGEFHEALPQDHPLRKQLVRLGEQQLKDRLTLQSSVFKALELSDEQDAGGDGLRAELRTFERGDTLFEQGDTAEAVYIVVSGVAGIYTEKGAGHQLIARAEAGQCLGEHGILRREPHSMTVIAEERLVAFRIPGEQFIDMHARSPELREHLAQLESIYQLPRRGFVTQFAGKLHDRDCITSVYHLPGKRRAVATHVPSEELTHLVVHQTNDEDEMKDAVAHRFVDHVTETEREIVVSPTGTLLSISARGEWADLPELFVLALDGNSLDSWQCTVFTETGSIALESKPALDAEEEIICACMAVKRREVRRVILAGASTVEAIRDACRAGGACGACKPRINEMLGKKAWTPVRVVEATDVATSIRAFRLVPLKGTPRPALPGQHIVVQAQIDGRWVERPYTLSAPTSRGYYEVTIKRVAGGFFSSWFFDRRSPEALLRVSDPQGDFIAPKGESPIVYLVAGIGVTPAIAACRARSWALADSETVGQEASLGPSQAQRPIHISYSATKPETCAYAAEIEQADSGGHITANVRYTSTMGRIGQEGILAIVRANPGAEYFLCGPISYLANVRAMLTKCGVSRDSIHMEEFVSAGEGVPPPSMPLSLATLSLSPNSLRRIAPPSSHAFALPPSSSHPVETPRIPTIMMPDEPGGTCPFAHGTHREDGIGHVPPIVATRDAGIVEEARAYLAQFYREKGAPRAFAARWVQVVSEIERTGTYTQTYDELSFGAKLAWRSSVRCIGRLFWNGLHVRDMRHLTTEAEMLKALMEHIELATNGGNLRPLMTVFRPQSPNGKGPRIWNSQLLRYAGYRAADGSVLGDPQNAELTDHALRLGWKSNKRTRFDLLPIIVQIDGREPQLMEIPRRIVREVHITHPEYPFFTDLGLKWYALPAVSDMLFDVGGIKYAAAPFNGWYMGTEIGARNFSDQDRYNLLPEIAERLGLDTRRSASLWKDRAQLELTRAVGYSFERAGVKLVDHHTASDDFLQFLEAEKASGRCVHIKWSWVVPPIGGSATTVFFIDEDRYSNETLKPNFFYQSPAYESASEK